MKQLSDPKPPCPASRRRLTSSSKAEPAAKKGRHTPGQETVVEEAARSRCWPALELSKKMPDHEELIAQLTQHGVPQASHQRLLPLLKHVGPARLAQVLGLWSFLGDGEAKPAATASLQVWGPAGSGKSEVVSKYLRMLDVDHVKLNVACFTSSGELRARLVEVLRQHALAKVEGGTEAAIVSNEALRQLRQKMPPGRQIRTLDRLEVALRTPLEHVGGQVVVLLENSQQLSRLGHGVEELMLELPEVLQRAKQLVFVFVGRLPFSCLGVPTAREPPAVAFQPYSAADVEKVLAESLMRFSTKRLDGESDSSAGDARSMCNVCVRGLMTFAVPYLGHNLNDLLRVGEEFLRTDGLEISRACTSSHRQLLEGQRELSRQPSLSTSQLGHRIESLVQQRVGLCDLSGLLEQGQEAESGAAALVAATRRMVKTEKRLLVAAYLASRLHKDDDVQHFLAAGRGKHARRASIIKHQLEDGPATLQEPRLVPLTRLFAIYHRLAQEPQALGPALLEQVVGLHEAGLLRFAGGSVHVDRDAKVVCRAELPLVSMCAADFNINLAEYGFVA